MTHSKFLLLLLLGMVGVAVAQSNPQYDVSKFDISGVKLGMTATEARETLKSRLSVTDSDFNNGFDMPNRATGTKRPTGFSVRTNGIEISISLSAKIPVDDVQTMIVSQIRYQSNGTVDAGEMRRAAIAKYGPPTNGEVDAPGHFPAGWCQREKPYGQCMNKYLRLNRGELHLFDIGYSNAENQYATEKSRTKQVF